MNHLELEHMDKKDRLMKLTKVYERVQRWIQIYKGTKSPSEMNIAMEVLREIEEFTSRVNNIDYIFTKDNLQRLNRIWKQYKV